MCLCLRIKIEAEEDVFHFGHVVINVSVFGEVAVHFFACARGRKRAFAHMDAHAL